MTTRLASTGIQWTGVRRARRAGGIMAPRWSCFVTGYEAGRTRDIAQRGVITRTAYYFDNKRVSIWHAPNTSCRRVGACGGGRTRERTLRMTRTTIAD